MVLGRLIEDCHDIDFRSEVGCGIGFGLATAVQCSREAASGPVVLVGLSILQDVRVGVATYRLIGVRAGVLVVGSPLFFLAAVPPPPFPLRFLLSCLFYSAVFGSSFRRSMLPSRRVAVGIAVGTLYIHRRRSSEYFFHLGKRG